MDNRIKAFEVFYKEDEGFIIKIDSEIIELLEITEEEVINKMIEQDMTSKIQKVATEYFTMLAELKK